MLETTGRPFGGCGHQGGRRKLKRGGILWDWFGDCIWLSLVNPGLEERKVMKFREADSHGHVIEQRLWLGFPGWLLQSVQAL